MSSSTLADNLNINSLVAVSAANHILAVLKGSIIVKNLLA